MSYLDEATTALVRPYAITQGRTHPRRHVSFEALIGTTVQGRAVADHRRDIYRHETDQVVYVANVCRVRSHSLAELTAYLRLPIGITRVIVADMAARGLVTVHEPLTFDPAADPRAPQILEKVLAGLRAL